MKQRKFLVRVLTVNGITFNIEVKADTEAQAMAKAKREGYVRRVIQAYPA